MNDIDRRNNPAIRLKKSSRYWAKINVRAMQTIVKKAFTYGHDLRSEDRNEGGAAPRAGGSSNKVHNGPDGPLRSLCTRETR